MQHKKKFLNIMHGQTKISTRFRLIGTSETSLRPMIENGEFNRKLFHMLNIKTIHIPPLRERREDITFLSHYLIEKIALKTKTKTKVISAEFERYLLYHEWPGNVKELETTIKRAFLLSQGDKIQLTSIHKRQADSIGSFLEEKLSAYMHTIKSIENFNLYDTVISEVERALIMIALKETRGNQVKASKLLNINRNTIRKKIKEFNINLGRF